MEEKQQDRKKVFVKTYGCQMNVYDSARMQDALEQDGYVKTTEMVEKNVWDLIAQLSSAHGESATLSGRKTPWDLQARATVRP